MTFLALFFMKGKLAMPIKDHLGNEFPSIAAMASFHGITYKTLQERLKKMSVKDAIETPVAKSTKGPCKDHLGNTYKSKAAMCKAYGIEKSVFFGRINLGWTLEKALTMPDQKYANSAKAITDHMGQKFISVSEMCKHWNITRVTYNARRKAGWSIEDALTTPVKNITIAKEPQTDHLGNTYESLNAMCQAYKITRWMYKSRIQNGWSVEDALTKPLSVNTIECTDGFGHKFPSLKDLGNYYNIREYLFQGHHLSEEEMRNTIIKQMKKDKVFDSITIIKPITFPYYLVQDNNEQLVMTFDDILDKYHNSHSFSPIPQTKVKHKHITKLELIKFPYYSVEINGNAIVMSYWNIIEYNKQSNFGLSERSIVDEIRSSSDNQN